MTILAVDNHPERLAELKNDLKAVFPEEDIMTFIDPMLAVKYSVSHEVDALLTITDMKRMDGCMLSEGIRRWRANVRVFYIIEDGDEPFDTYAAGYLKRPITQDSLSAITDSDFCLA